MSKDKIFYHNDLPVLCLTDAEWKVSFVFSLPDHGSFITQSTNSETRFYNISFVCVFLFDSGSPVL